MAISRISFAVGFIYSDVGFAWYPKQIYAFGSRVLEVLAKTVGICFGFGQTAVVAKTVGFGFGQTVVLAKTVGIIWFWLRSSSDYLFL